MLAPLSMSRSRARTTLMLCPPMVLLRSTFIRNGVWLSFLTGHAGRGLLDHRFIGLEHRHRRLLARDGLNARAEGRACEKDCVRTGTGRVTSERQETSGHCVSKPAITRQVGRQAVVEQIHQM